MTYLLLNALSPQTIAFLTETEPFRLLISVILSAQTTDAQVNEVVGPLFATYPTADDLAHGDPQKVASLIHSTGFYNAKTKNIIATAKRISTVYDNRVPLRMEELLTLPGVGRKTANVILGHIAQQPAIIVDTHFRRVVKRIGLTSEHNPDRIEKAVGALLPPQLHYRFSMIINLHGREICYARHPRCKECLIAAYCQSYPIS